MIQTRHSSVLIDGHIIENSDNNPITSKSHYHYELMTLKSPCHFRNMPRYNVYISDKKQAPPSLYAIFIWK